jgi:hypothetical protein
MMTSRTPLEIDLNARPRRSLLRSRGGKLAFAVTLVVVLIVAEVWRPPAIGEPILLGIRWLLAGAATFLLGATCGFAMPGPPWLTTGPPPPASIRRCWWEPA